MHKPSIISIMEGAVLKAGRSLSRDFGEIENLQVSKKGPGDFVTSADIRSEEILIEELRKSLPGYGFLIEESGEIKGTDEQHRWIADPLDGTTNYMHGVPHFCISLALGKKNYAGTEEIIAGVIYSPILNEFYWAEKGQGAYMGNRRLSASGRTNLNEALLGAYLWHACGERNEMDIKALSNLNGTVRILGSAALEMAYIAAGKLDVFWNNHLKPWDLAAGMLLIQESRGIITEIDGGNNMLKSGSVLASNTHLHSKVAAILSRQYEI